MRKKKLQFATSSPHHNATLQPHLLTEKIRQLILARLRVQLALQDPFSILEWRAVPLQLVFVLLLSSIPSRFGDNLESIHRFVVIAVIEKDYGVFFVIWCRLSALACRLRSL